MMARRRWIPHLDVLKRLLESYPDESGADVSGRYFRETGCRIGRNTVCEYRKLLDHWPESVDAARPESLPSAIPPGLLLRYEGLVIRMAIRFGARRGQVRDSEQYADGWLGLLVASRRFDPGRGVPFLRFATRYVKGQIRYGCRARLRHEFGRGITTKRFSEVGEYTWESTRLEAVLADESAPGRAEAVAEYSGLMGRLDDRARRFVEGIVVRGERSEDVARAEDPPVDRHTVMKVVRGAIAAMQYAMDAM